jgi:hypothetical protein
MARTQDYKEILKRIETTVTPNFHVRAGGDFVRIHPETGDDHRGITRFLKENQIEGYILPLGPPKFLKVVIRKLPIDTPEEEIKQELIEKGYPVTAVSQIISAKTGKKNPLFTVQLQADSPSSSNIWELKRLCYERVTVEKWIPPRKVRQCHRCQFFHHNSENCMMKPRCVKCSGPHLTPECPHGKGKIDDSLIKCCNCNESHPASYQGCKKYPVRRFPHPSQNSAKRSPGVSYAQCVKAPNAPFSRANQGQDPERTNETAPLHPAIQAIARPPSSPTASFPGLNLTLIHQVKELITISNEISQILGTTDLTEYITAFKTLQGLLAANSTGDSALGLLSGMLISSSG